MTRKGLGMTAVLDAQNRLAGIFTDGDLRRVLDRGIDVHHTPMQAVMTANCKTIAPGVLAAEAVHLLEQFKINGLLIVDDSRQVVGALNIHDLLRAGVM
jgi:arabinose-5-phosphate isomerase